MLSESVRKKKKALSKERKLKCKEESQEKVRLVTGKVCERKNNEERHQERLKERK